MRPALVDRKEANITPTIQAALNNRDKTVNWRLI